MLRKIRLTLAIVSFALISLLFLDFTGSVHAYLGWMAKIQFLPALLALNFGVVIALVLLTLLFGRVYCSVICPLGVMQDIFAFFGKKAKKNRYTFSPAKKVLRYAFTLILLIAVVLGFGSVVALIAPYSTFGRIAQNLLAPLWQWANNLLALIAEKRDSYAFYSVDVWIKSISTFVVSVVSLILIGFLAWRNGRTWCNTVCPVGTILGIISKYSVFKPVMDKSKCNSCGLCSRNCKSSCIDVEHGEIDYSRCVACMDCIDKCNRGAISYTRRKKDIIEVADNQNVNKDSSKVSRSQFILATAGVTAATVLKAQEKTVDGGLAAIVDKKIPVRQTPIVPPGALGLRNMAAHCTACQLCVSVCPTGVLRPSTKIETFMQPESSYERGYCRPECTKCSDVCPAGAITKIDVAEKSSIQIGHAVWVKENCIVLTDEVDCGNCARHCPTGAIQMMPSDAVNSESRKIPLVNVERCIGCGACENLCPARPFSAIYVEGHERHRFI